MRFANNFNPEWGYLAPAPNFARTARIVVIAAAIGATAGAAVVLSLVEHPGAEESSVAARTLVQPADSGASQGRAAQAAAQWPRQPQVPANGQAAIGREPATLSAPRVHAADPGASESGPSSTVEGPASVAGLAETPAVTGAQPAPALPETPAASDAITAQKKAAKKQHLTWRKGPLALLHSFATPATPGAFWGGDY